MKSRTLDDLDQLAVKTGDITQYRYLFTRELRLNWAAHKHHREAVGMALDGRPRPGALLVVGHSTEPFASLVASDAMAFTAPSCTKQTIADVVLAVSYLLNVSRTGGSEWS